MTDLKVFAASTALLLCVALNLFPQVEPVENRPQDSYQISVNLRLVVLQVTVTDRDGNTASGLSEQSFEVYDNNARQTIRLFRHEDVPVAVGLVVDHSGSMRRKLADVVAGARAFVRTSNPEDEVFVINFNERVTQGLPAAIPFTHDIEQLETAISRTTATGQTALYDALVAGLEKLQSAHHEKRALIVFSDGGDNASRHGLAQALQQAELSNALVYTVGTFDPQDPDRNPGVLNRLARATGGEAHFPANSGDVPAVCERIAEDLRSQYTIGFVSNAAGPPGSRRAVRVVVRQAAGGKLSARTRAGYVALDPVKAPIELEPK